MAVKELIHPKVFKIITSGGGIHKIRECLRCHKSFKSKGKGNRICYRCMGARHRIYLYDGPTGSIDKNVMEEYVFYLEDLLGEV